MSSPDPRVEPIVRALIARWITPGYHPHVQAVGHINMGPCEDFAGDLINDLLTAHPDIETEMVTSDELLQEEGLESDDYHVVVRAAGFYYDASHPDGECAPDYMNMMGDILRAARRAAEGESDSCDEDGPTIGLL